MKTKSNFFSLFSAAIFGATLFGGPAFAQAPLFNWNGFYTGLSGGYGIGKFQDLVQRDDDNFHRYDSYKNGRGFLGGAQAGYNWQLGRSLAGIEADFSYSDIKRTALLTSDDGYRYNSKMEVPWFATLRARVGFLPTDQFLFYATGGLIYGRASTSRVFTGIGRPLCSGNCSIGTMADNKLSWTAGAGFEYFVSRVVTFKFEYLYADLGSKSGVHTEDLPSGGISDFRQFETASHGLNIFRFGFNYHY